MVASRSPRSRSRPPGSARTTTHADVITYATETEFHVNNVCSWLGGGTLLAREGTAGRLKIQRGRLPPAHRHFGSATSRTRTTDATSPIPDPKDQPPKSTPDDPLTQKGAGKTHVAFGLADVWRPTPSVLDGAAGGQAATPAGGELEMGLGPQGHAAHAVELRSNLDPRPPSRHARPGDAGPERPPTDRLTRPHSHRDDPRPGGGRREPPAARAADWTRCHKPEGDRR